MSFWFSCRENQNFKEENMNVDVFISYSSKNKNVADAVVSDFEQNGIRCWYAPRDIMPGKEWVAAIKEGICSAKVFVLLFTEESNASRQVMNEVALAFNAEKTIVPFKLTEKEMSDELEYYLTRVHWLDAVSKPLKNHIDELRKFVELILSGSGTGTELTGELTDKKTENSLTDAGKKTKTGLKAALVTGVLLAAAVILLIILKPFGNEDKKKDYEQNADKSVDNGSAISKKDLTVDNDAKEKSSEKGTESEKNDADKNGTEGKDDTDKDTNNAASDYHVLGSDYLTGRGDAGIDEEKALYYLEMAYNDGNGEKLTADEYYFLAYKYDSDESIKDPEKACKYALEGAGAGSVQCMVMLGDAYWYGNGVEQDYEQVLAWFGKALDSGVDGYSRKYCINCITMLAEEGHVAKEAASKWVE